MAYRPSLVTLEERVPPSSTLGTGVLSLEALGFFGLEPNIFPSTVHAQRLPARAGDATSILPSASAATEGSLPPTSTWFGRLGLSEALSMGGLSVASASLRSGEGNTPPLGPPDSIYTILWVDDDSYVTFLAGAFTAEGRIGDTVTGGGTFELDIGPDTAHPFAEADYTWNQDPAGHPFRLTYDPAQGAAFNNNHTPLTYNQVVWTGPPEQDTLFIRTNATKNNSQIVVGNLQLYTPTLGQFVPVPYADGSDGPASIGATGPSDKNSLQILGADLQDGFILIGTSYWTYATSGPDAPSQSQLAFQITAGTWYG
jgi:hypothetical protein